MPVTKSQVANMNGARLWQLKRGQVPSEQHDASVVFPVGIEALVRAFDHGFSAPIVVQDDFLVFLRALPGDAFSEVVDQIQTYYSLCRAFRVGLDQLGSPPTYLDLYRDDRVRKKTDSAYPGVLINSNELLRTWPDLMAPAWNPHNAPRDSQCAWEKCRTDVDALHRVVDREGLDLSFS
jgi:hypothetical protein